MQEGKRKYSLRDVICLGPAVQERSEAELQAQAHALLPQDILQDIPGQQVQDKENGGNILLQDIPRQQVQDKENGGNTLLQDIPRQQVQDKENGGNILL